MTPPIDNDFRMDHYRMPTPIAQSLRRVYVGKHFGCALDLVTGMFEGVVRGLELCVNLAVSDFRASQTHDPEVDALVRHTQTRTGVWRYWELLEALSLSKHDSSLTFLRSAFLEKDTNILEWQRATAWLIDRLDSPGFSRNRLRQADARFLAADMDEAFTAYVKGLETLRGVTLFEVTETRTSRGRNFAICKPFRGFLSQPPLTLILDYDSPLPRSSSWYVHVHTSAVTFPFANSMFNQPLERSENPLQREPKPAASGPTSAETLPIVLSEDAHRLLCESTDSESILLRRENTHSLHLGFDADGAARYSVHLSDIGANDGESLGILGPNPPAGCSISWNTATPPRSRTALCYTFVSDSDVSAAEILHMGGKLTTSQAARVTANASEGWLDQPTTKRTLEHLLIAPDGHAQWTPVRVADSTRAIDVNAQVPIQIFQCFQSLAALSTDINPGIAQNRLSMTPNAHEVYTVLAEYDSTAAEPDLGAAVLLEQLQTQLAPPVIDQIRDALALLSFPERINALQTLDETLWGAKPRFLVQLAITDEFARHGDTVRALDVLRGLALRFPADPEVLNRLRLLARTPDDWQHVASGLLQQFESTTSKEIRRRTMEDLAELFSAKLADPRSAIVAVACAISEDPDHWESRRLAVQLATHHSAWDMLAEAAADAGVAELVSVETLHNYAKQQDDHVILEILNNLPALTTRTDTPATVELETHPADTDGSANSMPSLESLLGESGSTMALPLEYYLQIQSDLPQSEISSPDISGSSQPPLPSSIAQQEPPRPASPTLATIREQIAAAEAAEQWQEAVSARRTLIDLLIDQESKAMVLVEMGDIVAGKLMDMDRAADAYEESLSYHPESKATLGRLLELRMNQGHHAAAAKILKRFAELEDDPIRRASHLVALGILYRDYLHDLVIAGEALELALDLDPLRLETFAILDALRSPQGAEAQIQSYERMLRRLAPLDHQEEVIYKLLTNLAKLYRSAGHLDRSVRAWRKARAMRPDDQVVHRALGGLYESADNTLDEAVAAYLDGLSVGPFDPAIVRSLRRVFTRQKQTDGAWCACGVLIQLGAADEKEKTYYDSHVAGALKVSSTIRDNQTWEKHIYSENQNVDVGRLFEALFATVPSLFAAYSPSSFGTPAMQRVDLSQKSALTSFASTIPRVLGINVPTYFHARLATGIMKVSANPAALLLGADVMEQTKGKRLRYMLGRAITLLHGPHLVAGLRPADDLRDIAYALQLVVGGSASKMDYASNNIRRWAQILTQAIDANARKALFALAPGVFRSPEPPDVDGWLRAIDFTASNAGLLLCNDIAIALECMEAEVHPLAPVPLKERTEALMRYALSPRYHELRAMLGIAVA